MSLFTQLTNDKSKFFLLAGPCAIETEEHVLFMAGELQKITERLGIPFVFKAAWDKANRSSIDSYRGLGITEGLRILQKVKDTYGVPVITDVHETSQVAQVAEVADIIQIPAFLCRQTDLLLACAKTQKIVNVKKGQFVSAWDARNFIDKIKSQGNEQIMLTERGNSFGYNNLVVDMRGLPVMREFGYPVVYDATHSLQLPGGLGTATGGLRQYIPNLARAAVACGIDGLFMEVHDNPEKALSDATTQFPLRDLESLLKTLQGIHGMVSIKKD